nr:Chain C, M1-L3W, GIWGFVFTL [synthetic construct]
GIWGFVFTL